MVYRDERETLWFQLIFALWELGCTEIPKYLFVAFRRDRVSFADILYFLQLKAQTNSAGMQSPGMQGRW